MTIKQSVVEHVPDTTPSDTPDAAVQRYVMLLLRWEELTRRQQAYDQELAKLQATGDQLRPEWDALAEERRTSLAELQTLTLPFDTVITQVYGLVKAHLHRLCEQHRGKNNMAYPTYQIPSSIEAFGKPLILNRRIEE